MMLADLPTPCLVLDRTVLERNLRVMSAALARHKVPLRPHMKTAKSIDVARLAIAGQFGGITVSTLAEAEYFFAHGIVDILYAVGITPQKLAQVVRLNTSGARIIVLTDDPDVCFSFDGHSLVPLIGDPGDRAAGIERAGERLKQAALRLPLEEIERHRMM